MNKIEELLLYILGAVIHDLPLDAVRFMNVTKEEWAELYRLSKAQGVTAVVFDKLSRAYSESEEFPRPPKEQTLKWYAQSMAIEKKMSKIRSLSAEFAERMAEEGLHTLVLKGIAISTYYPNPLHREFGDLDCYLFEKNHDEVKWESGYERGNVAAEGMGALVRRGHYKHSHVVFKKLEIENHQFFLPIRGSRQNKELERQLRNCIDEKKNDGYVALDGTNLLCPNANFNALFLTAHAMNHFLYESVKVRHLLDWALFLKAEHENVDWGMFWKWCDKMHYTRFVECLNHVCRTHFDMCLPPLGDSVKSDSSAMVDSLSVRVIRDIFNGDSVYNKGNSNMMVRLNLVRNFFASAWKYRLVAQRCMITDLLRQVTAVVWDKHPKM